MPAPVSFPRSGETEFIRTRPGPGGQGAFFFLPVLGSKRPVGTITSALDSRVLPGVAIVLALAPGCGGSSSPPPVYEPANSTDEAGGSPWFREVHEEVGIDFVHVSDAGGALRRFPEIMGGGAALADLEGDGDPDLYLVQSGELDGPAPGSPVNRLFRNGGAGRFTDITEESGSGDPGYGMGVALGDVDNDGTLDLYVTNVGPNVLLLNRGALTFEDRSERAGVDQRAWSTSAAFFDLDVDGRLDLFCCNYVDWSLGGELACSTAAGRPDYCSPNSYDAPVADSLYRNEGDGRFTDVSAAAGLFARRGNGLGVVCGDFDGDGAIDIFVANDQMENHLWHNGGDGTFTDIAGASGCAVDQHGQPKAGMGTLAEDVDGDDDLDVLVVNLRAQADSFFRNEGAYFNDDTAAVGLGGASRPFTRFGVGWVDFNNDGFFDLYQANGRVAISSELHARSDDPYAEPNLLFTGQPGGRFGVSEHEGGVPSGLELVHTSRAAAFGDIDGDGGMDVVVVNRDAFAYVLRNVVPDRGHWARFRVLDGNGRDALGAELRIEVEGRSLRRDVKSAYSYCAANDPRVHVGLGDVANIRRVRVRWPGGREESFGPFEVDRDHILRAGEGTER